MVSAFVLAGGKSTRMGSDKAFLEFDGQTLLARALQRARAVASQAYVVGPREKFESVAPVIEDVYPERGPLAAIHAALRATPSELSLVLAVDLPLVSEELLRFLLAQAQNCDALATVPRVQGRFQPLCAVYRRGFAELAEASLEAGRNKIDPLFQPATTRVLEQAELEAVAFPAAMFENLNTPEDVERILRGASAQTL